FNDDTKFRCSGRRESYAFLLHNIFQSNLKSFKVAYQIQNYLWTHAGISNGFWDEYENKSFLYRTMCETFNLNMFRIESLLANTINDLFFNSQRDVELLSTVGYQRGGHNKFGGIFWADKNELHCRAIVDKQNTALTGYNQIVGHNPVNDLDIYQTDENTSITFIDCQEYGSKNFLITEL
ncbi:MAG: hypothetical protein M0R17_12000, partial [Candidatus Omnitrophica bacterium]|nr:hypothetical protein [Candidatus Omnitrophota bacterium]